MAANVSAVLAALCAELVGAPAGGVSALHIAVALLTTLLSAVVGLALQQRRALAAAAAAAAAAFPDTLPPPFLEPAAAMPGVVIRGDPYVHPYEPPPRHS